MMNKPVSAPKLHITLKRKINLSIISSFLFIAHHVNENRVFMRNLLSTLIILIATATILPQAKATEVEIVQDIIAIHQKDARALLGREVALKFYETSEAPNANASHLGPNNGPLITYYSSLLYLNKDDDVVTVVCHELGHILGSRKPGITPAGFALEGEADYFAGKCAVRYYTTIRNMSLSKAQEAAYTGAQQSFSSLYKIRIDANQARFQQYPGINPSYSKPECRVLTVYYGALGWNRPACWYNP